MDVEGAVHELTLTLASPAIIKQLGVVPRAGLANGVPNIMTVYASLDGADWAEVAHFEELKDGWAESAWRYFDLTPLQRQTPSLRQLAQWAQREIDGVKYAPIVRDGAWDYLNLPATDGAKAITYVEDANSPFAGATRYALTGQNFFPRDSR